MRSVCSPSSFDNTYYDHNSEFHSEIFNHMHVQCIFKFITFQTNNLAVNKLYLLIHFLICKNKKIEIICSLVL